METINFTYVWAILGIVLLITEVFTSTFFILFFGISALLVAMLRVVGLNHLATEIIVFAVIGIAGTLIFRSKIVNSFRSTKTVSSDKDQLIKLTEDIASGETGSVYYQGVPWTAINDSKVDFNKGETAVIDRIDGVKLILKPKDMVDEGLKVSK